MKPRPAPARAHRGLPAGRGLPAAVAGAFALSGTSALVYELVWFRLLGDVFGSTAAAAATVLAAYLFGLGLGAWLIGHRADRLGPRLVAWYVGIEAAIAGYGLASRWLFDGGAALYAVGYRAAEGAAGPVLATRFAISFLLVALPTVLMGGTFPLMVRIVAARGHDAGVAAGRAYAVNTAGAALGALALPMVLLPAAGFTFSLVVAASGNVAAALLVYGWARGRTAEVVSAEAVPAGAVPAGASRAVPETGVRRGAAPLVAAFLLSSFVALVLETAWARHLGIHFGSEIHTFAFVLFAYLAGLVAGGALYARQVARGAAPGAAFRAGLLVAGLAVAATVPFLDRLLVPQLRMTIALGVSYNTYLATLAVTVLALVFPAALGFGLALPAVVDRLARSGLPAGASVGATYAVNTLGTTAGALCAGFVLVPSIGTQRTLELCVALLAAALALASNGVRRWFLVLPAIVVALLPRWDWALAHAGYAKSPLSAVQRYRSGGTTAMENGNRVVWLREGATATVGVLMGPAGDASLLVNGKADASTQPLDMITQRLLGAIPALFHEAPRRGLVIGLGSGVTAAALLRFPLESVDVVEISPEVVAAARAHFAQANEGVLDRDPRLRLHVDDGRTFLEFRPPATYDLIVSEPSNPWVTGVSTLFTDEFFALAKARLRPGGVLGQWFHYYSMSQENLRVILRTFARHFPETAVMVLRGAGGWTGDLLLVGVNGPLALRHAPDDPALPGAVRAMLAETGNLTVQQSLAGLALTPETIVAYAGDGPLNTDDRPVLELRAPADRFVTGTENFAVRMFGPNPRLFLPIAAPGEDGLAAAPEYSAARAVRTGLLALTRVDAAGKVHRFVLTGREVAGPGGVTEIWHIDGSPPTPEKVAETAVALLPGGGGGNGGRTTAGGHDAIWVEGGSAAVRTIVLGWHCPVRQRAFFVVRSGGGGEEVAREMAAHLPCDHGVAAAGAAR